MWAEYAPVEIKGGAFDQRQSRDLEDLNRE